MTARWAGRGLLAVLVAAPLIAADGSGCSDLEEEEPTVEQQGGGSESGATAKVGDKLTLKGTSYEVTGVDTASSVGSQYTGAKANGIFIVVATVSGQDGLSVAPPEIIFRGVPFVEETDGFVDELRDAVDVSLERSAKEEIKEIDLLQDHLHDDVAEFVYERLRRRPMILPVVVEV